MNLGENLRQVRLEKKLTQEDVSKVMFVTRQTISRWEQNKTMPNVYVLEELSRLYEVPIDRFYDSTREMSDTNKEEKVMKNINYYALFGSVFFNIFLFSGVAITVATLLLSYWLIVLTFIASPFILLFVNVTGMQAFDWVNTLFALIVFPIGLINIRIAKKFTGYITEMFIKYCKFNMKSVFNTSI